MRVNGRLDISRPRSEVFQHAVGDRHAGANAETVVLTRYETKVGPLIIETTEEATLVPEQSITWRHKDGPLSPHSWETFRLEGDGGSTSAYYEGEIEPRNGLLKGPLTRLWVAPQTKRVSIAALKKAKAELES